MRRSVLVAAAMLEIALAQTAFDSPALAQTQAVQPRNIALFIADGLRFCMVDDNTAPTVAAMARQGVTLRNGHALFPTFTMANASGMATGHMLGDTGTYSNTIYTGFEVPGAASSLTPFLESDVVLGDIDEHFAAVTWTKQRSSSWLATKATARLQSAKLGRLWCSTPPNAPV